jgi:hypothetical protein
MLKYTSVSTAVFIATLCSFSCSAERVDVVIDRAWFDVPCVVPGDCVQEKIYDVCGDSSCPDVAVHRESQADVVAAQDRAKEACGGSGGSRDLRTLDGDTICQQQIRCITNRCVLVVQ